VTLTTPRIVKLTESKRERESQERAGGRSDGWMDGWMEGVDDLHVCLVIFYFRLASSENDDQGNSSDLFFSFLLFLSLSRW